MALEIIDIVKDDFGSLYIITNEPPVFLYERKKDNILYAKVDPFLKILTHHFSNFDKAFGGCIFSIPMKDGSSIQTDGYWWCSGNYRDVSDDKYIDTRYISLDELKKQRFGCLFKGAMVKKEIVDNWETLNKIGHIKKYEN